MCPLGLGTEGPEIVPQFTGISFQTPSDDAQPRDTVGAVVAVTITFGKRSLISQKMRTKLTPVSS